MINWKVRLLNKQFWLEIVPAVLLLVQVVANAFGMSIDLGETGNRVLSVVNAVFGLLAVLGVVVDPTTEGIKDSERAMMYDEPWKDDEYK